MHRLATFEQFDKYDLRAYGRPVRGGGMPEDKSAEVAAIEAAAARREASAERRREQKESRQLRQTRSDAAGGALSSGTRYFEEMGLDSSEYADDIQDMLSEILAGIPKDDPNPGNYLKNFGQQVWDSEQEQYRSKLMRDLDRIVAQDFEYTRVDPTLDDATLAAIEAEQRGEAENYIQNLLDRGVITAGGFGAAEKALGRQSFGVKATLEELGRSALEGGRQSLRDIAGRGRSKASTIGLGQPFDPYAVGADVDREFQEFLSSLGGGIRSKVSGNLYDTSGLPVVAGAAMGAGNTKFDPKAIAGIFEDEDEEGTGDHAGDTSIF